jgi:hypothetical protein
MYEKLVKRLRAVAGGGREEKCDGCPYEEDYPCCVDCLDTLHKQAADAIEELSSQLDDFKRLCLPLKENRLYKYSDGSFVEVSLILLSEPPKDVRNYDS